MALGFSALLLHLFLHPVLSDQSLFAPYGLNFSSSSPHIFASTFGLLQQWSNTFYPYGHSITPCEVPINTNLYHARIDGDLPTSPEWFAFDAEMSYAIAGTTETSHMLTYRTTKKVKCIYFDGASAGLNEPGNMDSQMVFIYNNSASVPDAPLFGPWPPGNGNSNNRTSGDPNGPLLGAEYDRAEALCSFIKEKGLGGKGWGYEGIVRMNAGFEMIWCDFDSPSLRLVSHINVSAPLLESTLPVQGVAAEDFRGQRSQHVMLVDSMRPQRPQVSSFWKGSQLAWLTTTTNSFGMSGSTPGRGEVRVKPHLCGTFSFYDMKLGDQEHARIIKEQKSLNLSTSGTWVGSTNASERDESLRKLTRRRRQHRILNVSTTDGIYMRSVVEERLRAFLNPATSVCSELDWRELTQGIVMGYSTNLHDFLKLLQQAPGEEDVRKWLRSRRELTHMLMMPYYEYPTEQKIRQSPAKAFSMDSKQARDAFARCRDQSSPESTSELSDSETVIHAATRDVLDSICGTTLKVFLSVEALWFTATLSEGTSSASGHVELDKRSNEWRREIEELMAWLGWGDQWTSCQPGCGLGQVCWIPIWPLSFLDRPGGPPPEGPGYGGGHGYWPGPGYGHGAGYGHGPGHGHRGPPPGFGHDGDRQLWEPHCINRTQVLT